jgi:hypothetical protein
MDRLTSDGAIMGWVSTGIAYDPCFVFILIVGKILERLD